MSTLTYNSILEVSKFRRLAFNSPVTIMFASYSYVYFVLMYTKE